MTMMARCLEGHAFDTDTSATCPTCGSTVWRDAVKEAAEKAAREAREAKAAKEAKAARDAAERIDNAKSAKAAKEAKAARDTAERADKTEKSAATAEQVTVSSNAVGENNVVARAARAARDAREAKAAREARAAGAADGASSYEAVKAELVTNGVPGAAEKARRGEREQPRWVSYVAAFVGVAACVFLVYLFAGAVDVYRQYSKNQPDNTAVESVVYTTLLELRHGFQARATDVPYGPNAARSSGRDGLVSTDATGEPAATPTRGAPRSAIRDALTRAAPVSPETSPRTMPNPFATPNR